jgi:NDP-sugar pyrophosphorylase family protein
MSLQAIILAGGMGTRLRPLTDSIPKPLVPVAGRPYLEHQVDWLRNQGIVDIVLLVSYLAERIEQHFGDGTPFGVSIRYSREPQPAGTGGALKLALPLLEDSFLVLNGDSYLPMDYRPVAERLQSSGADAVIAAYDNAFGDTGVKHNLRLGDGDLVTAYDKSGQTAVTHVDAGVIALRRQALALSDAASFSLENDIFPRLIAGRRLLAFPVRQRFYDMGTPAGLAMLEAYLKGPTR